MRRCADTGHAGHFLVLALVLLVLGCSTPAVQPPPQPIAPPRIEANLPVIMAEADRLRAALDEEVPQHTSCNEAGTLWIELAQAALAKGAIIIERPQLVVVVDRNPNHQQLCIVLALPGYPWQAIGGSKVSTGQAGRRGYFITPTGVFVHSDGILDYRAEGTFNENHIRGLGLKGSRVWDFGWQQARKGWTDDEDLAEIRLLLHATDPVLESRLGRPASKGCVRIPAVMNRFLDSHGVLDADYEIAAATDERIRAVLLPDRHPTPLAGDMLIVIDTSGRI
mgnify:CR=1 FL=1|jgi:hypothetical protein